MQSSNMVVPRTSRVNGTYHATESQKERLRRVQLLIAIGAIIAAFGIVNVVLVNADMTRLEEAGPQQLALAGGGISHFVPSILGNLQRAQQSANTVSNVLSSDPRHSPPFIQDKRALERWVALTGFSLAAIFIGLENRIPLSSARPRSPTGTDLSRLLILLSLSYGALSIFEAG